MTDSLRQPIVNRRAPAKPEILWQYVRRSPQLRLTGSYATAPGEFLSVGGENMDSGPGSADALHCAGPLCWPSVAQWRRAPYWGWGGAVRPRHRASSGSTAPGGHV